MITNAHERGVLYATYLSVPAIFVCCIIDGLGYFAKSDYLDNGISLYDSTNNFSMAKLVSFADLLAVWTTIFAFSFIVLAIAGELKNRKTKQVLVEKNRHFVWAAIVSIILIGISLAFTIFQPFADVMIYLTRYATFSPEQIKQDFIVDKLIGSFLLIVVLDLYLMGTFVPIFFENHFKNKAINPDSKKV